jgi:hypothetical protein
MHTALNSIYGAAGSVVAHIPDLPSLLSQRRIRMASTSEELLDLFEERYSEQHELDIQQKPAVLPSAARPFRCRGFSANRAKSQGGRQ